MRKLKLLKEDFFAGRKETIKKNKESLDDKVIPTHRIFLYTMMSNHCASHEDVFKENVDKVVKLVTKYFQNLDIADGNPKFEFFEAKGSEENKYTAVYGGYTIEISGTKIEPYKLVNLGIQVSVHMNIKYSRHLLDILKSMYTLVGKSKYINLTDIEIEEISSGKYADFEARRSYDGNVIGDDFESVGYYGDQLFTMCQQLIDYDYPVDRMFRELKLSYLDYLLINDYCEDKDPDEIKKYVIKLGHFDKIGNVSIKSNYNYDKKPVCSNVDFFTPFSFREWTMIDPWDGTAKNMGKIREFCENTGFTAYIIKPISYEDGDWMVVYMYDTLMNHNNKNLFVSLVGTQTGYYTHFEDMLSCIMSPEDAKKLAEQYKKQENENDGDEWF